MVGQEGVKEISRGTKIWERTKEEKEKRERERHNEMDGELGKARELKGKLGIDTEQEEGILCRIRKMEEGQLEKDNN